MLSDSEIPKVTAPPQMAATGPNASAIMVLYITYDGVLEPLGRSQVLEYIWNLASRYRIVLISFEKRRDWLEEKRTGVMRSRLIASGVEWIPLRYHKRPSLLATTYDVGRGLAVAAYTVWRRRVSIVHVRSYVAGVIGLFLKRMFGVAFLFDMRGFWPDEKVEAGAWTTTSVAYRVAKWFERRFMAEADIIVSLTRSGVEAMRTPPYLVANQRFEVIPTCTNQSLFRLGTIRDATPRRAGLVVGFVGSFGLWYMPDEMVAAFAEFRRLVPDARLVALNRDAHESLRERLEARGIPQSAYTLKRVAFDDVPDEMRRMDVGVFFIRAVPSKRGSAPTKLGEFLASGVPCLINEGTGDSAEIVRSERVGVVLNGLDGDRIRDGVRAILELLTDPELKGRCAAAAARHFNLHDGVEAYARIYDSLAVVTAGR